MLENLSIEEQALLDHLGKAWNMFVRLPPRQQWERWEFMQLIHQLQNMITARPFLEELYDYEEPEEKKVKIARI